MCNLTQSDKEKLGNTVVYIASHVVNLSKTKLLKLLYFMEEYSVRRFHTPFLGLPFEVWQAGPVAKDVFIDLSETPIILDGYITKQVIDNKTYIKASRNFCDDEFSDNDMLVMQEVLKKYSNKSAKELKRLVNKIDFRDKLTPKEKEFYKEQLEFLQMSRWYAHKEPAQ